MLNFFHDATDILIFCCNEVKNSLEIWKKTTLALIRACATSRGRVIRLRELMAVVIMQFNMSICQFKKQLQLFKSLTSLRDVLSEEKSVSGSMKRLSVL
jgi:hypothetical protein